MILKNRKVGIGIHLDMSFPLVSIGCSPGRFWDTGVLDTSALPGAPAPMQYHHCGDHPAKSAVKFREICPKDANHESNLPTITSVAAPTLPSWHRASGQTCNTLRCSGHT